MIEVDRGSPDFGEIDTAMKPRRPLGTMVRNPGIRRPYLLGRVAALPGFIGRLMTSGLDVAIISVDNVLQR
jgi:hypothetical protein